MTYRHVKAFVALLYMLTVDCCWLFHSSSLQLLLNWDQSQRSSFSNLWIPGKYFSLLIFRFVSIEITSYFLLRHASQNYEFQGSISHLTVSYLLQTYCCSQGVSDGKIQITILILRRRPYLVFLTHQFYICIFVTTILLQFCTEPTVFWNCKKGLLLMAFSSKLSTLKHRDSPQCYQYFKARYWYFEVRYRYFEDGYRYFEAIYRYFEARYQYLEARYRHFKARYHYFKARYRYFEARYRYFEARYRYFEAR